MRICIAVGLLVLACGHGVVQAQPVVTKPGTHELTLPGSERRYTLIVPRGYSEQASVPLVVSLHFGGPLTPYIGRSLLEQLIEPALHDLGAIMVAPDSAADGWANPTAEAQVLELISYIEANYNVDASRTLLTGYSMGGMGTWYLAPRHPEVFEAAIPMAGRPQTDSITLDWQTPTYVINSSADELTPIQTARAAVESLQARGAPLEIAVLDNITHFQIPRYRRHLQAAIPWLMDVWNR